MTTAIVVGSGPNGLAAAVTLAFAGVEVTVLEADERLGGGTRSGELTLPVLLHDECSGFHPLSLDTPFSRSVDLAAHALVWRWPEVQFSHPLDGGRGAAAWQSIEETAGSLGRDGSAWRQVFGPLVKRFDGIVGEITQPVLHVPDHPIDLVRFGLRAGLPAAVLARRFRSEEGRALFAGVAAHAFRPFGGLLSSSIGVALGTAAHRYGWPVAEGGTAAISDAMVAAGRRLGVRYETGARVETWSQVGGADLVMLDTSPSGAVRILGDRLPGRVASAYRRYRHGPGAFKVDSAVEGGVPWAHEPSRRAGTVHVGGDYSEVAATEKAVNAGRMPDRPFVLVGQQHLADPGRSRGDVHPLYAYAHVPSGFAGDATDAVTRQIERFAPGFRERVLAVHVTTTAEFARGNANYVGGDIVGGANDPRQLVWRPRATWHPYATGVDGVFLCSAATPPGAGAHGMCGFNAARAALARLDPGLALPKLPQIDTGDAA